MSEPASPSTPSAPDSSPPGLSEGTRLIGVFLHPEKSFADLKRNARWWVLFLLLAVANLAVAFTIDHTVGFAAVAEQSIQSNAKAAERLDSLPADVRARQMAAIASGVKYTYYAGPVISLLVLIFVATILLGTFNFGLGRELRFGEVMATVIYAMLPTTIYAVLQILVLAFSGRPETVNVQNLVATNPAFFFDQATTSPALYVLLRSFDLFSIWPMTLLGVGLAAIGAGKRSTTLTVVFSWWLLLVLGFSALAALR